MPSDRVIALASAAVLVAATSACSTGSDRDGAAPGESVTTPPTEATVPMLEDPTDLPPLDDAAWLLHPVDWRFEGAGSIGPGDLDGDGFDDYVTSYLPDGQTVVSLHPGESGDVRAPWATVDLAAPPCADPACDPALGLPVLADLDGDGALDIVGAGGEPGVRVAWGPPADRVTDPAAWTDGGVLPSTLDPGGYAVVRAADVDVDGDLDVVAGGRGSGADGGASGIVWLEAPTDPAARRDLAAWRRHDLAPDRTGAGDVVLTDLDADGDDDLVVADDDAVLWYENPGAGDPAAQRGAWNGNEVHRGELGPEAQITVADLDGDGSDDVLTQVDDAVLWFRTTSTAPVTFEQVVIEKDPVAQHTSGPLRVADLDGDGRLDLVGGLVHDEGSIPGDKASIFWMSPDGDDPTTASWTTHAVTWGAGTTSTSPEHGETWNDLETVDVDRDGDLDLVASNEAWWERAEAPAASDGRTAVQAVVWFENRLREPRDGVAESAGLVTIDAASFADDEGGTWTTRTAVVGSEGDGYAQATAVTGGPVEEPDPEVGRRYAVEVTGGRYAAWALVSAPDRWGAELGGAASDSAWLVVDGAGSEPRVIGDTGDIGEGWTWVRVDGDLELAAGPQTVRLLAREGGVRIDRIVLVADGTDFPQP